MKKCFALLAVVGILIALFPDGVGFNSRKGLAAGAGRTPVFDSALAAPQRSSSAIALSADGQLLLAANPDSNSVTLIDAAQNQAVAEIPVGVDPRCVAIDDAGRRAYVTNRGADSLSVIDLAGRAVVAEIALGDRPYGVIAGPDGSRVYVAEQGSDRVCVIDTAALQVVASFAVADRPSGLAITDDGQTLLVTHLLSGRVSVVSLDRGLIWLPLVFGGAGPGGLDAWLTGRLTQPASRSSNGSALAWPAGSFPVTTLDLWPDSNLVQSVVLSPDQRYAYLPHTRSNAGNRALTFDTTVFPLISIIDLTSWKHLAGQQLDLGTLDPPGVGLPFDAAITPDGQELWIVNAASNDISVIDLPGRSLVAHIQVGANPRGIVLAPGGQAAYVNNTLAGTVSVIDTQAYTVTGVITTTEIPLPPALLNGKRLFHSSDDPRVSLNQWIACNTCHFEGEQDGRTWSFGFAGPRNTTSLLGMVETYPLRWSGEWNESADSEFANRRQNFGAGLIEGEMNCSLSPLDCAASQPPNAGRSNDLDSLALFIDSLRLPLSPAHAQGQPLSAAELRGQELFNNPALGCLTCHPAPLYTDFLKHDVGTTTADERIGPEYDTPTLRGLYDSAPYFHDGSAETLYGTLSRPSPANEHDVTALLSQAEIEDLVAFLLALPFE